MRRRGTLNSVASVLVGNEQDIRGHGLTGGGPHRDNGSGDRSEGLQARECRGGRSCQKRGNVLRRAPAGSLARGASQARAHGPLPSGTVRRHACVLEATWLLPLRWSGPGRGPTPASFPSPRSQGQGFRGPGRGRHPGEGHRGCPRCRPFLALVPGLPGVGTRAPL